MNRCISVFYLLLGLTLAFDIVTQDSGAIHIGSDLLLRGSPVLTEGKFTELKFHYWKESFPDAGGPIGVTFDVNLEFNVTIGQLSCSVETYDSEAHKFYFFVSYPSPDDGGGRDIVFRTFAQSTSLGSGDRVFLTESGYFRGDKYVINYYTGGTTVGTFYVDCSMAYFED